MGNKVTNRTVLNSGLRVLTGHVSDQATNYYNIRINIGSGFSDDEIDGQAHFLEHMLFNGVNTSEGFLDYKTLRQNREKDGVGFGAYTTPVKTCYTARIPINLGQQGLDNALEELSRMLITPALPEERIEHEKKVICNEWGARQGYLSIYLYEQVFINGFSTNSSFGHRCLGEKDDIKRTSRQDLLNFMTDHYTQPNTSVVVTGPVDHDVILRSVGKYFSDMPINARPDYPVETPLEESYAIKGIDFIPHNFLFIGIPWPGCTDHKTSAVIDIAGSIISDRLNNNIREETGNTYGLDTGPVRFRQEGFFTIQTSTEPETVSSMIKSIVFELKKIANGDISEELEAIMKGNNDFAKNSLMSSEHLADFLSDNEASFSRLYDVDEAIEKTNAVTAEDVQGVIRQALNGVVSFAGIGIENAFMPQAELKAIFSLPQQEAGIKLNKSFKLDI